MIFAKILFGLGLGLGLSWLTYHHIGISDQFRDRMNGDRIPSIELPSISTCNNKSITMSQGSFIKKAELANQINSSSSSSRRLICRYGRGCTHSNDLVHREQYWHPPLKEHECK